MVKQKWTTFMPKYFSDPHSFLLLVVTMLKKFSLLTVWPGLGMNSEFKKSVFPEQENHYLFFCPNEIL